MNAYLNKDDDRRTILKVYDEHNEKLSKIIGLRAILKRLFAKTGSNFTK